MNKVFSIVWSESRQGWVIAHESAIRHGKPSSSRKAVASLLLSGLIATTAYADPPLPNTLPTGGQVAAGQAAINQTGNTLNILQTTGKAIINWNSFNIGSNATVNFAQPNSSSVALNRVLGSDPSSIFGHLNANGQVFLINPNGVLFGKGARVDVGGLVDSTLNITDLNFMSGNYQFSGNGASSVVNQGDLLGRYVALLAPEVRNEGVIVAQQGTVAMLGGTDITLNLVDNQLIDVVVNQADIDTLVENKHLIQAEEGSVILSAQSANHLLGKVVNSGDIDAGGITSDGGKVRLTASSEIQQSGNINVDAGTKGNGGSAILIASLDNPDSLTTISGNISAKGGSQSGNGGFVETSASHLKIASTARIDTRAPRGTVGKWLLDPYDFTIAAAGGDITGADLSNALNISNVTIQTTNTNATCTGATCGAGNAAGNGDIFVNDAINWTTPNSLTLDAWRDIIFNQSVTAVDPMFPGPSSANLFINYGAGGTGKAVIKSGVSWSIGSPNIVDNAHSAAVTPFGTVDTSRDFWIGTKGVDIFVQLNAGSGTYGTNTTTAGFYDAAGGNRINISAPTGSVAWNLDPATLGVAGSPYSLSYVNGLTSGRYSGFTAGSAANWTVNPRPITLTANDRSKTFGDVLALGSTAFTVSSGTLAAAETLTSVTLASANGYAGSTTQIAGSYTNEIAISGATGGGGFNASNYNITFNAGDLTINPVVVPPVVIPNKGTLTTNTAVAIVQSTPPVNPGVGGTVPVVSITQTTVTTVADKVNTACNSNCDLDTTLQNGITGGKYPKDRTTEIKVLEDAVTVAVKALFGGGVPESDIDAARAVLNKVDSTTQNEVFKLVDVKSKLAVATTNQNNSKKDLADKQSLADKASEKATASKQAATNAATIAAQNPSVLNQLDAKKVADQARKDSIASNEANLVVETAKTDLETKNSAVVSAQSQVNLSTSVVTATLSKNEENGVQTTINDKAAASTTATTNSAAAAAAKAVARERKAAVIAQLVSLESSLTRYVFAQSAYGAKGPHVDAANDAMQKATSARENAESTDLDTLQRQLDNVKAVAANAQPTTDEYNKYNLGGSGNNFMANQYLDKANDLKLGLQPIALNKIGSDAAVEEAKQIVKDAKGLVTKAKVALWIAETAETTAQTNANAATGANKAELQEIALKKAYEVNVARAALTRLVAEKVAAESALEKAEVGSKAANLAAQKVQDALEANAKANKEREQAFYKALADKAEADRIAAELKAKQAQQTLAENARLNKEREQAAYKALADKKVTYAKEVAAEATVANNTATQAAIDKTTWVNTATEKGLLVTSTAKTAAADEAARKTAEANYLASKDTFEALAASAQSKVNAAGQAAKNQAIASAAIANAEIRPVTKEQHDAIEVTNKSKKELDDARDDWKDAVENASAMLAALENPVLILGFINKGETPESVAQKVIDTKKALDEAGPKYSAAKAISDDKTNKLNDANAQLKIKIDAVNDKASNDALAARTKINDEVIAAQAAYNKNVATLNAANTKANDSKTAAAQAVLEKAAADQNATTFTAYAKDTASYASEVQEKAYNARRDADLAAARIQ